MLCHIGLGANIGPRSRNLARAVSLLARPPVRLLRASAVYETAPVGYADQPPFLNMVVAVETDLPPLGLLRIAQDIEDLIGRRRTIRYGPRSIDVDLLRCDGIALSTPELALPHPRMLERQFVMVPLCDIAPRLRLCDGSLAGDRGRPGDPEVKYMGRLCQVVGQDVEAADVR